MGYIKDLPKLVKEYQIDRVTLAIPSLSNKRLQEIMAELSESNVKVSTMPSIEELAAGKVNINRLKEIDVVDLLGREEVKLDIDSIQDQLSGQIILVTGAEDRLVQKFVVS